MFHEEKLLNVPQASLAQIFHLFASHICCLQALDEIPLCYHKVHSKFPNLHCFQIEKINQSFFSKLISILNTIQIKISNVWSVYVNFFRKCQTSFQSSCTILCSHQQCVVVMIVSHPHQYLVLPFSISSYRQF